MNILVTGGNGFVGSHLVERLLKEEHHTTVVDYNVNLSDGNFNNKIHMFQISAEDSKCEKVFADTFFDVVVHLAYHTPASEIDDKEMQLIHKNQVALSNILYLSHKYHVHKVIVLTTYHVYGRQENLPICEEAELRPDSLIGYHQQTRELSCREYRRRGLNVIVLRAGYIFGPRQKASPDNYIQLLINDGLSYRQVLKQDTDLVKIDYIFINDVIEAILLAAVKETSPILNISSGKGVTRQEIYKCCLKIFEEQSGHSQSGQPDQNNETERLSTPADESFQSPAAHSDSTKQSARIDYILDNKRASHELDWLPKYALEDGIRKTIEWSVKSKDKAILRPSAVKTNRSGKLFGKNARHTVETLAFFGLALLLAYLVRYQLGIDMDIFLLYVAMISLFYGIRQGGLAIVLAIAARICLLVVVEDMQMIVLVNDVNIIMQLTLYLIMGVCIGYAIDNKFQQKENIFNDLNKVKRELDFVNVLYQKSLDVKNSLQFIIENNTDSLGKSLYLISRLERVEQDQVYDEIAHLFADVLKSNHVHVYGVDATGQWLRLLSTVGDMKYNKSIQVAQYGFLGPVIKDHSLFINKELKLEYPLVCVPVCLGDQTSTIIFIDGIEFINLTQHLVNTLKILIVLVSESIERKLRYEGAVRNKKYYENTFIMREEWFEKQIKAKIEANHHQVMLLKINNEIRNYRKFSMIIKNMIRSIDSVGEISKGQLGIILTDIEQKDLPTIITRFSDRDFSVDLVKTEVR